MEDDVLQTIIGKAARAARDRLGLTQAQVAEKASLSAQVYGRIERGAMMPAVPTLRRLAVALGTSPGELLGITPREVPRSEEDFPPDMRKAVGLMRTWSDGRIKAGCEMLGILDRLPMREEETVSE